MHLGLDFVSFFVVPSLKQIRNDTPEHINPIGHYGVNAETK